ncbi:MAG: prepilin peptidase [Xanthomonadales bacterium]|nr:A24 family peptidase [Gammaproteobacteria bacterium]NNE06165.1 prepilin peptidase [Xanthomonadales bacterium]NNL95823.1 prepilin peptidase [Xanthomonadales bacterium]
MFTELFHNAPLFLTGVFLFGLLIGSFLNVVILRLPARLEYDWKCQCRELLELPESETGPPPDLVWSSSRCTHCGHVIRPWENIPVISYVLLGGKCSACKSRISPRYPLVELLTAVLFLVTAWQFGATWHTAAALLLTAFLVALSGIDIDHQLLPDQLTVPLLWIGLAFTLTGLTVSPASGIIGALAGYLSLWSVYHLFRMLTGKEGMGYGDFKLLGALGAWMGWQMLPLVILFSSLVGAVVGVTLLILKRHKGGQAMPFGPYLAAAGWLALLWGEDMIELYIQASGL